MVSALRALATRVTACAGWPRTVPVIAASGTQPFGQMVPAKLPGERSIALLLPLRPILHRATAAPAAGQLSPTKVPSTGPPVAGSSPVVRPAGSVGLDTAQRTGTSAPSVGRPGFTTPEIPWSATPLSCPSSALRPPKALAAYVPLRPAAAAPHPETQTLPYGVVSAARRLTTAERCSLTETSQVLL